MFFSGLFFKEPCRTRTEKNEGTKRIGKKKLAILVETNAWDHRTNQYCK